MVALLGGLGNQLFHGRLWSLARAADRPAIYLCAVDERLAVGPPEVGGFA